MSTSASLRTSRLAPALILAVAGWLGSPAALHAAGSATPPIFGHGVNLASDGFFAATNGDATQLYACVNQSSGEIKLIAADGTCPGKSAKVTWSVQGPEGEPGLANHSVHERTLDSGGVIASGIFGGLGCPGGKRPLGGGVQVGDAAGYAIVSNRPLRPGDFGIDDPQGWFGFVLKVDSQASFVALEARMYVICAVVN